MLNQFLFDNLKGVSFIEKLIFKLSYSLFAKGKRKQKRIDDALN